MKKIIYLLMVTALVFTSACNPMEDIYDDLDAEGAAPILGEDAFEMSDEDYDFLDKSYGNFNSTDEAKELIPDLLDDKFPVWGKGSLAAVTYKLYAPKKTEKSLIVYKVTSDDYAELGFTYGNFSSFDEIVTFLDWKYPNPEDRVLISLTYKYYSGGVSTLKNGFISVSGEWQFLQGFTRDEYNAMGENYDNFTSSTVAEKRIPIYLKDYFKYETKEAGDIQGIMYNIYQYDDDDIDGDGDTSDKATYSYAFYCIYDGTDWTEYENILNETVKFGHDGSEWVPDNTIKYTLTGADYALTGDDKYSNYYVKGMEYDDAINNEVLPNLNIVLPTNFPNAEEGQKFNVYYNVYTGANEVWNSLVILEGGEYVLQAE